MEEIALEISSLHPYSWQGGGGEEGGMFIQISKV